MARFEINLVIKRPVEEVFAFVSNPENQPRWRTATLEITRISDAPLDVGSVVRGRFTFLGRPFEGNLEILVREPHRRYATRLVEGPFPLQAEYTLEPDRSGTRLTLVVE